jgi:serine/threonine protein kinase
VSRWWRVGPGERAATARCRNGQTPCCSKAHDELLGRDVAVKIFHREAAAEDAEARRQMEIEILAGLNHHGLVTVFDTGADDSRPADPRTYVVMELVDGPTLSRVLVDGPLAPSQVAVLGAQLADALAHIHAGGVIHRDIKPGNILTSGARTAGASAKLADFGIARHADATRMTAVGSTIGTANYLSPEQVTGATLTPASDMYSFGIVLIECLSGAQAFPGHGATVPARPRRRDPVMPTGVGRSWQRLLADLTQRDPMLRPDADQVRERLRQLDLAEDEATSLMGPLPGIAWQSQPAHRVHRGRRRPLWAVMSGLAALAVLAAVLLLVSGTSSGSPAQPATSVSTGSTAANVVAAPVSSPVVAATTIPAAAVTSVQPPAAVTPATGAAAGNGHGKSKGNGQKSP